MNNTQYSTRDRILEGAFAMFSENGYKGTNLRDLAAGLGLSKSALYKHFDSKEAIWNELVDNLERYYEERFGSVTAPPVIPESCEKLLGMTLGMVGVTIRDPKIIRTRKLLAAEQYRDERTARLATGHFLTGLEDMFTAVFAGMMEKGLLKKTDPAMLAFGYTTPISALIHLSDREPERMEECVQRVEVFARFFIEEHRVPEGEREQEVPA